MKGDNVKERKIYQIEEDDWNELMRLSKIANETPVIALSVEQGLRGDDFASTARKKVFDKWEEIGRKYRFDGKDVESANEKERKVSAYPVEEKKELKE